MVIVMKEYYVFEVKKEFINLYREKTSELFYIYNRIYNMKEVDKMYGYNLFDQISKFHSKKNINDYIYDIYKDKITYAFTEDEHVINNLFSGEISILKVKNSCLKIETNTDDCSFFKDLKAYNNNFFVCSFKEQEYFFLKNYRHHVKNM